MAAKSMADCTSFYGGFPGSDANSIVTPDLAAAMQYLIQQQQPPLDLQKPPPSAVEHAQILQQLFAAQANLWQPASPASKEEERSSDHGSDETRTTRASEDRHCSLEEALELDGATTLIIWGLARHCTGEDLITHLGRFGCDVDVDYLYLPQAKMSKQNSLEYGFVNFRSPESAVKAVQALHGLELMGCKLSLSKSQTQGLAANLSRFRSVRSPENEGVRERSWPYVRCDGGLHKVLPTKAVEILGVQQQILDLQAKPAPAKKQGWTGPEAAPSVSAACRPPAPQTRPPLPTPQAWHEAQWAQDRCDYRNPRNDHGRRPDRNRDFDHAACGRDYYSHHAPRQARGGYPDFAQESGLGLQEALAFHKAQMERHREAAARMERHLRMGYGA